MDELRDFEFGGQVEHVKSHPTNDKPSLKWVWSCHVANSILNFVAANHNSERTEDIVIRFCNYVSHNLGMTTYPLVGMVWVT